MEYVEQIHGRVVRCGGGGSSGSSRRGLRQVRSFDFQGPQQLSYFFHCGTKRSCTGVNTKHEAHIERKLVSLILAARYELRVAHNFEISRCDRHYFVAEQRRTNDVIGDGFENGVRGKMQR